MPLKECHQNEYTGEERIYDCDRLMETSKTKMQRETRMTKRKHKKPNNCGTTNVQKMYNWNMRSGRKGEEIR